jgi:hypothetical protein
MVSYLNFAGIIANIQGVVRMDLDPKPAMTLSDLDQRLRRLEESQSITPPPALLDPTWESLAWRLCRLSHDPNFHHTRGPISRGVRELTPTLPFSCLITTDSPSNDGDDNEITSIQSPITLQKASDIVYSIKYTPWLPKRPGSIQPTAPILNGPEDKDFAHTVQRLLHVAGDRGILIKSVPTTLAQLYALAADVAIDAEASKVGPGHMPPLGPIGRPVRPPPMHPGAITKPCCGCCACTCHGDGGDDDTNTTASATVSGRPGVLRRVFGFGWVRGLMCWRKKRDFSDDSTISDY